MRARTCTRVVDARRGQGRMVLWLDCGHKLSVVMPPDADTPMNWVVGGMIMCSFCPNPTPVEERREKSVNELWKEAGEP